MSKLLPYGNLLIVLFLGYFFFTIPGEEVVPTLVYLAVVSLLTIPLYSLIIRRADPTFPRRLFVSAFLFKIAGCALRYWTLMNIYRGVGDAVRYFQDGKELAGYLAKLDFSYEIVAPEGTMGMIHLTGFLYTFLPASLTGAFFVFGWFAFVGSIFFYRAYLVAYPDARPSFFRGLIFFLPSILYWPSSLGKDAWIFFATSLVAYGMVILLRKNQFSGFLWVGLGLALTSVVRPHIAGFLVIAAAIAYLFSVPTANYGRLALKIPAFAMLLGIGYLIMSRSTEFLLGQGMTDTSYEGIQEFYDRRRTVSFGGQSAIEIPPLLTALGPLYALVTVLLRPLPFEAHNAQALIASLESMFWLWLMIRRRGVILGRLRNIRRDPWVTFSLVYVLIMIFALSSSGNLGIIARQRVMFLPFLWALMA